MSKKRHKFTLNDNVLECLRAIHERSLLGDDFMHIREIARTAGISPTTAGSILSMMEEEGMLSSRVLGKNRFYSIKRNYKAGNILEMMESHKLLRASANPQFEELARKTLDSIKGMRGLIDSVITYKSKDKGEESDNENKHKESDKEYSRGEYDSLLFITSLDIGTIRSALKSKEEKEEDAVKITVLTRDNLRSNLDSDMVRGILDDYIVLSGAERFTRILQTGS
ncbi:MAG: winged helix-turn-helix domain-containing protein [Candidatus Woesearchaeota archaeon]